MPSRPLSHIRVLDFGHYLAGPQVGMMLADMGAEVIRIDPPYERDFDGPAFTMLSRGKRSLTIDLKTDAGREQVLELAKRADVVIENFRPGVMQRLGLGQQDLRAVNNQLIYLSMPGFASTDEALKDIPAWEAVIAAYTGQFTDMGLNRRLMGVNPSFSPLALASAYGSTFGAMAVLFALQARECNGGDYIEVPLASALLEGLVYNCEQIEDYPERYKSPREIELERRQEQGLPMNLAFKELSEFLDPFYRTYTCADGRGFYVVSCSVASHPKRALQTLGLHELADELPDFDAYLDTAEWPASWSLRNYPVGAEDRQRVSDAMKAAFLTKPAHEWEALFGTAKAPATAQRFTAEWLHDVHALASGLIVQVETEAYGLMQQLGNVAWLRDDIDCATKSSVRPLTADQLADILAEPNKHQSQGAESDHKGWLDGLKVLDLTNVIAGPTIGSTLVRYGAEVTLVQPVEPSVDPWNTIVFGLHAQRGKRSALLNLSTDEGREALLKLAAKVDVITMNGTDQQREALGLTEAAMKAINPALIVVQLDAFGGPSIGPKSNHLGYDDLAQAATGIMVRFGGGMDTPEEHAHFGTIDVLTGFAACVALGGALERRRVLGQGGIARASLAAAGQLLQSPFMYDYVGRGPFDEPSGRQARGWGPYYHCYLAADQWLFFGATKEQHLALQGVPELSHIEGHGEEVFMQLQEAFAKQPLAYWQACFAGTSSTVVALSSLHQTRDDSLQLESADDIDISKATFRCIRHDQHPMGRWVDLVAPNAVRTQTSCISIPGPMPKYGQHTQEVLSDLGYGDTDINSMLEHKIAVTSWSKHFLPE